MNIPVVPNPRHPPGAASVLRPPRLLLLALIGAFALGVIGLLVPAQRAYAQQQDQLPPVIIIKHASSQTVQEDDLVEFDDRRAAYRRACGRCPRLPEMADPLPGELEYVLESFTVNIGQGGYNQEKNTIFWQGDLKPGDRGAHHLQGDRQAAGAPCDLQPHRQCRQWLRAGAPARRQSRLPPAQVILRASCDLGDAPDSTNHSPAAPMTAYPGPVRRKYPTVYDPATGAPSGPLHRAPRADAWLGPRVSGERDADLLPGPGSGDQPASRCGHSQPGQLR